MRKASIRTDFKVKGAVLNDGKDLAFSACQPKAIPWLRSLNGWSQKRCDPFLGGRGSCFFCDPAQTVHHY